MGSWLERNESGIHMGTSLEKRPFARPERKWEINIIREGRGYAVSNGTALGSCPLAV
jgi:hypothetical protein